MEARMLTGIMALVAGSIGAMALAMAIGAGAMRKGAALAAQGERMTAASLAAWRLRNGFAVTAPLARALVRWGRAREFADEAVAVLAERGLASTRESLLSVLVAAVAVAALVVGGVTGSAIGALACVACAVCVAGVLAGNSADKRREAVREAVPDALESMTACFESGFTLLQTFRQVAQDVHGPLAATFARSVHVMEMGGSAERALSELREGAHASELAFVAVALDVQHQSGGAMKQVLDAAAETVKGELALRRSLRVQTAQAKLSARVVVVMPFILVAAFSLATPDFLLPFFSSTLGYGLLALAVVMQVGGVLLVRRALSVEGVA